MSPPKADDLVARDRTHLTFLHEAGAAAVRHNSEADLLPHLLGTRDLLREWGARPALQDAGLFHSVYGTEFFVTATLPAARQAEVRAVIGAEAEALVRLWCFGRRYSLTASLAGETEPRMQDRRDEEWASLTEGQLEDLLNLWIADTLEQLHRVLEREVPIALELMRYRDRALPRARVALEAAVRGLQSQREP
ncbi:MAG: hypothetical protein E2O39_16640 [Planctomycetota bacterium]|nr:MAG: hypothetical protein E2O39_16640 [Planctomycetota bacterium]